jgi:hypothetical protein
MPDDEDLVKMKELEAKNPGANTYFYVQDPDYATLKERISAGDCVDGLQRMASLLLMLRWRHSK